MEDLVVISDLERIKIISDPLRIRIVQLLINNQATVKQIADNFGQSSAKIHYHVKKLEAKQIINLVETVEKGGIMEKYYRSSAKKFKLKYEIVS